MDQGLLDNTRPAIDDREDEIIPEGLPPVVDAHVHVFPDALNRALWSWFERHAWPIRYRMSADEVVVFLIGRGVTHVVALQYAHRPQMATDQNRFMAELSARHP